MAGGEEGHVWGPSAVGLQQPWQYGGGCHLLRPPRVRIMARVDCEGWGCWAPALSRPPQINLLIFMRILKVILAKLRANQKGYADYKLR